MIKKPNSVLSFLSSFLSLAVVMDYLLWPRTIKANETLEQGIQIKLIAGIILLLFSIYFRIKAKRNENHNGWTKASGIINTIVVLVFSLSFLFYIYIELNNIKSSNR